MCSSPRLPADVGSEPGALLPAESSPVLQDSWESLASWELTRCSLCHGETLKPPSRTSQGSYELWENNGVLPRRGFAVSRWIRIPLGAPRVQNVLTLYQTGACGRLLAPAACLLISSFPASSTFPKHQETPSSSEALHSLNFSFSASQDLGLGSKTPAEPSAY